MLHVLGPDTSNSSQDPETVMLQLFLDLFKKEVYDG